MSTPQRLSSSSSDLGASATPGATGPLSVGAEDDPKFVRDLLMSNPDQLALLKQNNPRLAEALLSENLGTWLLKCPEHIITNIVFFL